MLVNLHVKNLALIEEAEVNFGPGLNILTGETGAGKSILLGSMQLILGGKIQKNMVRTNAPYALVELLFETEDEQTLRNLAELSVFPEDGQILLSRRITDGRSVSRINGETCTISQMKAAAACLLDIHGQHEHQSLLYRDKQLEILDAFASDKTRPLLEKVRTAFAAVKQCEKNLQELDIDEEQRSREISFLEYEIHEIEKAALVPGEDEELEKRYKKLSNSRRMMETLSSVHALTGSDRGAGEQTGQAVQELGHILQYDDELQPLSDLLMQADSLLSDFARELSSYMDDLVFDEEVFYETEKRLDLINDLKARFGKTIEEILEGRDRRSERLSALQDHASRVEKARRKLAEAEASYAEAAGLLSEERQKASRELILQVVESLQDLNFLDVRFDIRFDKKAPASNGTDEIEYLISVNPGEEIRPLGQIVSGGELSRIMLALKAILASRDQIGTLIFDEIDAGISGRTAQKVSVKLSQIAQTRQVLCITHLPQIAAMADRHFEIEKHGDEENGTATEVHLLTEEDTIRELARLLGTDDITDVAIRNAAEMRRSALEQKGR